EATWAATAEAVWEEGRASLGRSGVWPLPEVVFRRWREVEIHHADLGLGFDWDDWSSAYQREDLRRQEMAWRASQPMGMGDLPPAALALPPPRRLAWLLGRLPIDGLPVRKF